MATSRCVKCDGVSFETVVGTPKNSKYKLLFHQCASCGGVVGVTEWNNIGTLIERLAERLRLRMDD